MAEISKKGNSFHVRVKVWESRGQLRMVGSDPAFKGTAGIHVPIKSGSASEESMRRIGAELGVRWPSEGLVDDYDALAGVPADELQEAVTNPAGRAAAAGGCVGAGLPVGERARLSGS